MKTLENVVVLSLEDYEQLMKNQKPEELEVGKWYNYEGGLFCFQGLKDGLLRGYGIMNYYDSWTDECNLGKRPNLWKSATHQEVEQALIKEAEKRGFKEGVNATREWIYPNARLVTLNRNNYTFNPSINSLTLDGWEIFYKGKWAEIITKPKIDYDRLKTGSVVMCKYTGNHCYGDGKVDLNKPLTLVFRKSEFYFGQDNIIKKEGRKNRLYDTFEQDGKFMLYLSDNDDHITEVISY